MRPDHHPRGVWSRLAIAGAAFGLMTIPVSVARADDLPTSPLTTPLPAITTHDESRSAAAPAQATGQSMSGIFRLTAGTCSGSVKGSTFRMIQPGGSASGPFVSNGDSPCSDQTITPMSPGTDGGLATGTYQAGPSPAFDGAGNGLAARITKPQKFFGADFATATNPTDPQTNTKVVAPVIRLADGRLTGDLRAFAASWNGQHFNQGAPKPDGSTPGLTKQVTGTFNPSTNAFVLDWTSQIVGGPFNNFTGLWHFEGTFEGTYGQATPTTTAGGGPSSIPTSVVSDAGAASTESSPRPASNLANTGLSATTDRGLALLAAGLLGLTVLRRIRRAGAHDNR